MRARYHSRGRVMRAWDDFRVAFRRLSSELLWVGDHGG